MKSRTENRRKKEKLDVLKCSESDYPFLKQEIVYVKYVITIRTLQYTEKNNGEKPPTDFKSKYKEEHFKKNTAKVMSGPNVVK